ncbi:MAG TPA: PKD domain-containing protein [Flavipsychrobacter sp.]|nr:PKD domain-containing protein [Flavipsychrobacter sp.]
MKFLLQCFLAGTALLFQTMFANAQATTPDWARHLYSTNGLATLSAESLGTDRYGNVYMLILSEGKAFAGGQSTVDSTTSSLITSWDCNGNLRRMKPFGRSKTNSSSSTFAWEMETDSFGNSYILGVVRTMQSSTMAYWGTDTSLNIPANKYVNFLIKYDSLGQFQWLRTPMYGDSILRQSSFSVSPSGDIYWMPLLVPGVYGGGAFTISNRGYYVVHYNAAGTFQSVTPLAITPSVSSSSTMVNWKYDPATHRFYGWLGYSKMYGSLTIGTTTVAWAADSVSPLPVLAAFNRQGQNLWVRQGNPIVSKRSYISKIDFGSDGNIYLGGQSLPGSVFCGDTAKNTGGPSNYINAYIMALDTNANLLWSKHPVSTNASSITEIKQRNNIIVAIGQNWDTLHWDGFNLVRVNPCPFIGFMLRADAANGAAQQLVGFSSTWQSIPEDCMIDKNLNAYVRAEFLGTMILDNDTFTCYPNINTHNNILKKYRNVPCGCNLLQPAFSTSNTSSSSFQFTYTGQSPYTSISWDFGDSSPTKNTSVAAHAYTAPGTYLVCVTVTNSCGSNTTCSYVTITELSHIGDAGSVFSMVKVYPNPARDKIIISDLPEDSRVEVCDIFGRRLKKLQTEKGEFQIPVEELSAGMYLLRFTSKDGVSGSRVFVKE